MGNLCCILSMFENFIPYLSQDNILQLNRLNFTDIFIAFIGKYSKLKHIKANINGFYKRCYKKIPPLTDEEIKRMRIPNKPTPGTLYTYLKWPKLSIDPSNHRNAVMNKIVRIYCLHLQRLQRFADNADIEGIHDRLKEFVALRCLEKRAKFEDKLYFFFQISISGKQHSVRAIRKYQRKYKICSNDICKKKGRKVDFKICSGCLCVLYCSKHCQKSDWIAGHRDYCKLINHD